MLNINIKRRVTLFILVVTTLTGFPLLADDTEIYLGDLGFSADIKPNILFIIDTSGSMSTDVTVTTSAYDPATIYTGDCDAARIYWDNSGDPPDCDTDNWFEAASNLCADSSVSLTTGPGLYVGRLARYRGHRKGDYWSSLNKRSHTDIVECQADWGVHGDGTGGTYPADEDDAGPFRSTSSGAINWNSTGASSPCSPEII